MRSFGQVVGGHRAERSRRRTRRRAPSGRGQTNRSRSPSGTAAVRCRRRAGRRRPRGRRRRRSGAARSADRASGPRDRPARRPGSGRGRAAVSGRTRSGASNTSVGGSLTIATSRPASAASSAMTAPASGRRVAPSRTSTANGGRRWSAARWRASDARKSRRSLLARPGDDDAAHAHGAGPRQRLGVDPRADDQDRPGRCRRRGRRAAARRPGSRRGWSRPRVGPPRATMPRIPRPAARIVIEVPGRTSRTMPATGVSSGSHDVAGGDPPARPPLEQVLPAVRPRPGCRRRRRRPGRSRASGRRDAARPAR